MSSVRKNYGGFEDEAPRIAEVDVRRACNLLYGYRLS
jgi:hypothetical protein